VSNVGGCVGAKANVLHWVGFEGGYSSFDFAEAFAFFFHFYVRFIVGSVGF